MRMTCIYGSTASRLARLCDCSCGAHVVGAGECGGARARGVPDMCGAATPLAGCPIANASTMVPPAVRSRHRSHASRAGAPHPALVLPASDTAPHPAKVGRGRGRIAEALCAVTMALIAAPCMRRGPMHRLPHTGRHVCVCACVRGWGHPSTPRPAGARCASPPHSQLFDCACGRGRLLWPASDSRCVVLGGRAGHQGVCGARLARACDL